MLTHSSIPRTFAHCLAEACPRKSQCLRWKAYELLPDNWQESISFVNPKSVPPAQGAECPHFLKIELQRYAKGMKRILDDVPHAEVFGLKREMLGYFGRNGYYRSRSGERLISPEEQKAIQQMFASRNLPVEISFDEYVEQYKFF